MTPALPDPKAGAALSRVEVPDHAEAPRAPHLTWAPRNVLSTWATVNRV